MSEKLALLTKADMTEAQRACFDLLCEAFHGEHHAPERIYAFGRGIKCAVEDHRLSTFDFDYLTRLVVLAHDACVRVEIVSSGPGRIGLVLHKRAGRTGCMFDRHPTMEEAIAQVRRKRTTPAEVVDLCTEEQSRARVAAERERCYLIALMAPFKQQHPDDDDGRGPTEMALKAMAFDITQQIRTGAAAPEPQPVGSYDFRTALQKGLVAGDGRPCPNVRAVATKEAPGHDH